MFEAIFEHISKRRWHVIDAQRPHELQGLDTLGGPGLAQSSANPELCKSGGASCMRAVEHHAGAGTHVSAL